MPVCYSRRLAREARESEPHHLFSPLCSQLVLLSLHLHHPKTTASYSLMGQHLSNDLKDLIPHLYFRLGKHPIQIAEYLRIHRSTVYRNLNLYRKYKTIKNPLKMPSGARQKVGSREWNYLARCLRLKPTLMLNEMVDILWKDCGFKVGVATMWRTLKRRKWSYRQVSIQARERDERLRALFDYEMGAYNAYNLQEIPWLDESAMWANWTNRKAGWGPRGKRTNRKFPFVRGQRISILPLLSHAGMIGYQPFEGSVSGARFFEFVQMIVVSTISSSLCSLLLHAEESLLQIPQCLSERI